MLNLTPDPVTLIAESGETTTIEPSGYVARVEYDRRDVDYFPVTKDDMTGTILKHHVPIIEQTPREIVADRDAQEWTLDTQLLLGIFSEVGGSAETLLLVTREVAEAAAYVHPHYPWPHSCPSACHKVGAEHKFDDRCDEPHPLASRMVWASAHEERPAGGHRVTEYRELHCVPGVSR